VTSPFLARRRSFGCGYGAVTLIHENSRQFIADFICNISRPLFQDRS
jgi:hypothetical protein